VGFHLMLPQVVVLLALLASLAGIREQVSHSLLQLPHLQDWELLVVELEAER
jgi:Tfp pilus assembly protein PilO